MGFEVERNMRPEVGTKRKGEYFGGCESEKIRAAWELAQIVHEGQKRGTGEDYVTHCEAVASFLIDWGADEDAVIAGLLHDTVEDHPEKLSLEKIEEFFGERVRVLVDGVTKFRSEGGKRDGDDFETLKKVTRETLMEPGVAMIKLADRMHNMQTMEGVSPDKRRKKADETLRVYVPLAESLGLWQVKNALADWSFQYRDEMKYLEVKRQIDSDPRLQNSFIEARKNELQQLFDEWGLQVTVESQVGGYKEMDDKRRRSGMSVEASPKSFADITDILSLRVIVENNDVKTCYLAKAALEFAYGEMIDKSRDDDFLVRPTSNGYSALHKSIRWREGLVEVAVTTRQKENWNNWGVMSLTTEERRLRHDEYVRKMIFTPSGEMIFLPVGARGIDAAYALDPWLGLKSKAMLVDGQPMGLQVIIPNASLLELILDSKQDRPRVEWLEYGMPATVEMVNKQLLVSEYREMVDRGKDMLLPVIRRRGIMDMVDIDEDKLKIVLARLGCRDDLNRLYFKLGYGLDLEKVEKVLAEVGIVPGVYTSIKIEGSNRVGISRKIAEIVERGGGDVMSSVEKVNDGSTFMIRKLIVGLDYEAKKAIEEELRKNYSLVEIV